MDAELQTEKRKKKKNENYCIRKCTRSFLFPLRCIWVHEMIRHGLPSTKCVCRSFRLCSCVCVVVNEHIQPFRFVLSAFSFIFLLHFIATTEKHSSFNNVWFASSVRDLLSTEVRIDQRKYRPNLISDVATNFNEPNEAIFACSFVIGLVNISCVCE